MGTRSTPSAHSRRRRKRLWGPRDQILAFRIPGPANRNITSPCGAQKSTWLKSKLIAGIDALFFS
jgi:hypothetical protein